MTSSFRAALVLIAVAVLTGPLAAIAAPIPVHIDRFIIEKNGVTIADDEFVDGIAPPSGPPGSGLSYVIRGAPTEADGRVRLDTVGSITAPGAGFDTGLIVNTEAATLLTNVDPGNTTLGLKSNHTFAMTGVFDLVLPSPRDLYGIRFTDIGTSNGDDVVRLLVGPPGATPDPRLFFTRQVGTSVTTIASAVLDFNHDQIGLRLAKNDASSDAATASFWYIDDGVAGSASIFAPTTDLFHGENFTRAEFLAVWVVPGPATLALLGAGVGLLAWRRLAPSR